MRNIYPLQRTRAWRSYLGGAMLNAFFGEPGVEDGHYPEEWILSTVPARNANRPVTDPPEGLTRLADSDMLFRDLLASEPERLLGQRHVEKYGPSPGVLFKLIDSAERLAIQVHPDPVDAKRYFRSEFGKTECWHILGGRGQPSVHFGFKPGITRKYWQALFLRQDIRGMLECLHKFEVEPGETFLIEGGIPHAIGAGTFLVEIQEPTDYTLRTEKTTPSGFTVPDESCHQGIGFENMLACFHYEGLSLKETKRRWMLPKRGNLLVGPPDTNRFTLEEQRIEKGKTMVLEKNVGFRGMLILEGSGLLTEKNGKSYGFAHGNTFFLAASTGKLWIDADDDSWILIFEGPK